MSVKAICVLVGDAKGTLTFTQQARHDFVHYSYLKMLLPYAVSYYVWHYWGTETGF